MVKTKKTKTFAFVFAECEQPLVFTTRNCHIMHIYQLPYPPPPNKETSPLMLYHVKFRTRSKIMRDQTWNPILQFFCICDTFFLKNFSFFSMSSSPLFLPSPNPRCRMQISPPPPSEYNSPPPLCGHTSCKFPIIYRIFA